MITLTNLTTGNAQYIAPAYSDIVIKASGIPSNILDNNFNIKFRCTVIVNNTTAVVLKVPVQTDGQAVFGLFKISSIIQDFTKTDNKGYDVDGVNSTFAGDTMLVNNHSIHQIDKYANNRQNLRHILLLGGYEYSTTATSTIIEQDSLAALVGLFSTNSTAQHSLGFSGFNFDDFILTASNKRFLSVFPAVYTDSSNVRKIQLNQYHTLAFFNGGFAGYANITVTRIQIKTFDNSGLLSETYIDNTVDNGGAPFANITTNFFNGNDNTHKGLLYFGCGTAQLAQNGISLTNVVSYTVRAYNVNTPVSNAHTFEIQDEDCKGFETIRLAFLNSLGAWDYYNFTKKSVRKQNITRTGTKLNYGYTPYASTTDAGIASNNTLYNYGTYDGGTRTLNINSIETIDANTDFITEEEGNILEELFLSQDVYMQNGTSFEPVVISDTEYIKQTSANNMLIQYIITIEKGHNKRIQRL